MSHACPAFLAVGLVLAVAACASPPKPAPPSDEQPIRAAPSTPVQAAPIPDMDQHDKDKPTQ